MLARSAIRGNTREGAIRPNKMLCIQLNFAGALLPSGPSRARVSLSKTHFAAVKGKAGRAEAGAASTDVSHSLAEVEKLDLCGRNGGSIDRADRSGGNQFKGMRES
jgi:hypothetical protein